MPLEPVLSANRLRLGGMVLVLCLAAWLTVAAATSASSSHYVFDGELHWQDWSWNAEVTPEYEWPVMKGEPSLSVQFTDDWAGLSFGTDKFDTGGYTHLEFMVHHNGGPIPSLQAALYDKDGEAIDFVPIVYHLTPKNQGWSSVSIPLSELGGKDREITQIAIQQRHGATRQFNVASVRFAKNDYAAKKPVNEEPSEIATHVFDSEVRWDDWSWDTYASMKDAPSLSNGASLATKYTAPWAGLSFASDGYVSGYKYLRFAMHGNGGPIPSVQATVYDTSGEIGTVRVTPYIVDINQGWYEVAIPLADLGAGDRNINRVTIQEGRGMVPRMFYVDEVRFTSP